MERVEYINGCYYLVKMPFYFSLRKGKSIIINPGRSASRKEAPINHPAERTHVFIPYILSYISY